MFAKRKIITSKRVTPEEKTHNYRKLVQKLLLIIIGIFLSAFAITMVLGLGLSAQKIDTNIVIIKPTLDGQIDQFLLASIQGSPYNSITAYIKLFNQEISLLPQTQLLTDQTTTRAQLAQLTLQLGIPIDALWQTGELPAQLSKEKLLAIWKEQPRSLLDQVSWWKVFFGLSEANVAQLPELDLAELPSVTGHSQTIKEGSRCSIAVVNTTGVAGVASGITLFIEKLGLVVVRVTDTDQLQKHSKVILQQETDACLEVVKVLQYTSPVDLEVEVNQEEAQLYRAALVYLVGETTAELQSW